MTILYQVGSLKCLNVVYKRNFQVEDFSPCLWVKELWPSWKEATTTFVNFVLTFHRSLKATKYEFRTWNCNSPKEILISRNNFIQNYIALSLFRVSMLKLQIQWQKILISHFYNETSQLHMIAFVRFNALLTPANSPLASELLASWVSFVETSLLPFARDIMSCWMEARFAETWDVLNHSLLSCWKTHQRGGSCHIIFTSLKADMRNKSTY